MVRDSVFFFRKRKQPHEPPTPSRTIQFTMGVPHEHARSLAALSLSLARSLTAISPNAPSLQSLSRSLAATLPRSLPHCNLPLAPSLTSLSRSLAAISLSLPHCNLPLAPSLQSLSRSLPRCNLSLALPRCNLSRSLPHCNLPLAPLLLSRSLRSTTQRNYTMI